MFVSKDEVLTRTTFLKYDTDFGIFLFKDESDAKLLAGKEKREMEDILKRGVERDKKVNEDRDKTLESLADTLPRDKVKSGADVSSI